MSKEDRNLQSNTFYHHHCLSAPTSPASAFIPFAWESKPGTPKHHQQNSVPRKGYDDDDDDEEDDDDDDMHFAFEYKGQPDVPAADELFEDGKIRRLKLPPRLHGSPRATTMASPKSPASHLSRFFRGGKKAEEDRFDFDPFVSAIEEFTRGRERDRWLRGSRRGSTKTTTTRTRTTTTTWSASPIYRAAAREAPNGGKKWRLKDLLLLGGASGGDYSRIAKKESFGGRPRGWEERSAVLEKDVTGDVSSGKWKKSFVKYKKLLANAGKLSPCGRVCIRNKK